MLIKSQTKPSSEYNLVQNPSNSANDQQNQAKRMAAQQLRSLLYAGIETLPAPSGKHDFELAFADSEPAQSSGQSASTTASPRGDRSRQASSQVNEAKSGSEKRKESPIYASQTTVELRSYETAPMGLEHRIEQLSTLSEEVSNCTICSELAACRKNTVFGVGNPQAELCFLGEGPGADEDRLGEPFVGQAGQLLNKIIGACKMSRDEVYILNTVKCRPPGNRNPNEEELENCWPYAIRQLEILQPKFICCLGSVAARTLLQTRQSIGRMRGQFFNFRSSKVLVTYHPAYLLRNPSAKRQVWDDMRILMSEMGREI